MRIAVVLVTYNRVDCLKIALQRYKQQTHAPKYVLVVNNASTDSTREYLQRWVESQDAPFKKLVINCEENTGGAGGFSIGVEQGAKLDCDFLFLADDDAYAESTTLEKLDCFYESSKRKDEIVAMCTAINCYGKLNPELRSHVVRHWLKLEYRHATEQEYMQSAFEVGILTFVGAAIKREAVKKIGVPIKEYFIHHDDTEYSLRLSKIGKIYCVPSSIMNHDTEDMARFTWKSYYSLRNGLMCTKKHYPKRYYYWMLFDKYVRYCSVLAVVLKKRTPGQIQMFRAALQDALHARMGISDIYKPGIDIESVKH